jgi:hypothetical protein
MLAPVKGSCTKPGGGQVQVSVMLVVETWGQAGGGKKSKVFVARGGAVRVRGKKSCASLIAWRVGPIAETILELLRASCRRQIRFLQSVHISAHIIHAVLAEEALN